MRDPWQAEVFKNKRGKYPVVEWARKKKEHIAVAKIKRKLERLARKTQYEEPYEIGRPMVDTLDDEIKELIVDEELRVLFSWRYEKQVILVLETTRKKGDRPVDERVIRRAKTSLTEWLATKSSDPVEAVFPP